MAPNIEGSFAEKESNGGVWDQTDQILRAILLGKRILKNIWLWYLLPSCLQKKARHFVSFLTDATVPLKILLADQEDVAKTRPIALSRLQATL